MHFTLRTLTAAAILLAACSRERTESPALPPATPALAVGGFEGPEAVKYDAAQDVFFVSNFGPRTGDNQLDNNGFISRLRPDGTVDSLRFIAGGRGGATLHMPRGMAIQGDTLWVADADAVRGFNRTTGAALGMFDFTALEPGFLNDVTVGGDGALYVTDTGRQLVYRLSSRVIDVAYQGGAVSGPNGITWDSAGSRFLIAPYRGGTNVHTWTAGSEPVAMTGGTGEEMDGLEVIGRDSILVASQKDSSLHVVTSAGGAAVIRLRGEPADIAWDPGRRVVAVPYISRDTVELFRLP